MNAEEEPEQLLEHLIERLAGKTDRPGIPRLGAEIAERYDEFGNLASQTSARLEENDTRSARAIQGPAPRLGLQNDTEVPEHSLPAKGDLATRLNIDESEEVTANLPPGVRIHRAYLHFDTNVAAEQYGERFLGPIRDGLLPEQLTAVRKFTEWSYPFRLLRADDPSAQIEQWANAQHIYEHLYPLTGEKPVPTASLLNLLSTRSDLTDVQRLHISLILNEPEPQGRIDQIWLDSVTFRRAARFLDEPPSVEAVNRLANMIDRAVDLPIPVPLHAIRELRDIDFLLDINGNKIGSRPVGEELAESLHGAIQTEPGFMSTSLGQDLAQIDTDESKLADKDLAKIDKEAQKEAKHILEIDIPAGSHGLWIGPRSVYPEQRELILARGTRYMITGARLNNLGGYLLNAEVILR